MAYLLWLHRLRMKKSLSYKQLIAILICSISIQMGATIQIISTSSLFEWLGVDIAMLSYFWLIPPFFGLCAQPIIGYLSDPHEASNNKRRPYLIIFGILTSISLILFPLAFAPWILAILLAILYIGINGCTIVLRAWIGDITPQQEILKIYSIQTIVTGFTSFMTGMMPWLLCKIFFFLHHAIAIFHCILISFMIIGCIVFIGTVFSALEIKKTITNQGRRNIYLYIKKFFYLLWQFPHTIKQLIPSQFFIWAACFITWVYLPRALAQHVYHLPLTVNMNNEYYKNLLSKGTELAGICFGLYQLTCVLFSFILPFLLKIITPSKLYSLSLLIGGLGLILCMYTTREYLIFLCMMGVGIMYSSITIIPSAHVTNQLPMNKMGIYLGVYNMTITLPQIITGIFLGPIVSHIFNMNATYSIIFSGILLIIASIIIAVQKIIFTI